MATAPIRVVHVVFSLGTGGLESGLVNLVGALDRSRFEHHVLCMKDLGPNAERLEAMGVRSELLGTIEGKNRAMIPKLVRAFLRLTPDVVHTRGYGTMDGVIAARLARVPAIVHGEHGWDMLDPEGTNKKRRFVRGALSPWIDQFICVSHQIEGWLSQHRGRFRGKVRTIHNGVDVQRFRPRRTERVPGFVVGTLGRLVPIKDQLGLIEAFARLAKSVPDARLEIVGDGPLRDKLRARAESLGVAKRVVLPGGTNRPEDVYERFDVFALPSLNEGISNTILEAMASGLPIVASEVGGNPELVRPEVNGMLVPSQDAAALAAALVRYAEDPLRRESQGASSRERAVAEFSLKSMAAQYGRVYELALGGRTAKRRD